MWPTSPHDGPTMAACGEKCVRLLALLSCFLCSLLCLSDANTGSLLDTPGPGS